MSPRWMQFLLGLSLVLNCFVLAGFVYRSWIAPPSFEQHMPPPPPPGMRPSPFEMLTHDLDLDAGQREALRPVLERYTAARRERFRETQKVRDLIAVELKRPQMDLPRIDGLVDQITRLRADQWKESLRAATELEPTLRPDQREHLHVMLAERFSGGPPPPPRPGMPGSPPPGPGGRGPGPGRPPQ